MSVKSAEQAQKACFLYNFLILFKLCQSFPDKVSNLDHEKSRFLLFPYVPVAQCARRTSVNLRLEFSRTGILDVDPRLGLRVVHRRQGFHAHTCVFAQTALPDNGDVAVAVFFG